MIRQTEQNYRARLAVRVITNRGECRGDDKQELGLTAAGERLGMECLAWLVCVVEVSKGRDAETVTWWTKRSQEHEDGRKHAQQWVRCLWYTVQDSGSLSSGAPGPGV